MFDFAWSEIGLIAFVSVMVMGPKQLPETMRTVAKVMRKVKNLGSEFQGHLNEMVREAELDEVRKQVTQLSQTSVTSEVTKLVDPTGELHSALTGEPVQSQNDLLAEQAAMEATQAADAARAAATPTEAPPAAVVATTAPAPSEPAAALPPADKIL